MGLTTIALFMFLYGGLCLLLYQEDLVLLYNPVALALSVFLGHRLVDGFVYTIAGVFLLRRQPWARRLALGYSALPVLYAAWMTVAAMGNPAVFDPAQFFVSQPYTMQGRSVMFALAITYVPLFMSAVFWWSLTRPAIRAQFGRGTPP